MPTAWKGFRAVLGQFLAPLVDGRVGNAQLSGHMRDRLPAGLRQPHCLALELLRVGLLDFLHDPCPPFGIVYPKISLFHKSGGSSLVRSPGERSAFSSRCERNIVQDSGCYNTIKREYDLSRDRIRLCPWRGVGV